MSDISAVCATQRCSHKFADWLSNWVTVRSAVHSAIWLPFWSTYWAADVQANGRTKRQPEQGANITTHWIAYWPTIICAYWKADKLTVKQADWATIRATVCQP